MSSSPLNFPSPSLFMHVSYKKRAHELINMARDYCAVETLSKLDSSRRLHCSR